ncbi:MAG: hypothetical protein E7563_07145 [Ruminococcaceae bacterium]|nr:hypothetical protein [Oscillospiraceae bacterium]
MLNSLSERIADFLLRQKCFEDEMLPVYVYGVKVFLSSLIGVVLVLVTSCILGVFESGVLFLLTFIILRQFTGGLHCDSYVACNVTTVITFIVTVLFKDIIIHTTSCNVILGMMIIISFIITAIFSPVSHPNKEIEQKDRLKFRYVSLGILILHIAIVLLCNRWFSLEIIIVTDFISSIYIVFGLIKNKTRKEK